MICGFLRRGKDLRVEDGGGTPSLAHNRRPLIRLHLDVFLKDQFTVARKKAERIKRLDSVRRRRGTII